MPIITDISGSRIVSFEEGGVDFQPIKGINYKANYLDIAEKIGQGEYDAKGAIATLIEKDLFFILYFIMGIEKANHPFVVKMCREIQEGPKNMTLDVWAREHYKSTIITVAETIQYHLHYPEKSTGIFAYKKSLAEDFLNSVRNEYKKPLMIECFPDILYENPDTQSPSWSLQNGITLKRKNTGRKEATVEASGLVEGMATGKHYDRRIYDDIETADIADNPDQLDKCFSRFEMSDNLGVEGGIERVIGTFYSNYGPIVRIRDKKGMNGKKMYVSRIVPVTHDGTTTGKPVLFTNETHEKKKSNEHYNSQQLCDPTPKGERKLSGEMLIEIDPEETPENMAKFIIVDFAGDGDGPNPDAWCIMNVGVDLDCDDPRTARICINDLALEPMKEVHAVDKIIMMYLRDYDIQAICIEKIHSKILGIHVAGILEREHGRPISEKDKTLVFLKPAGRNKKDRISTALELPFIQKRVLILNTVDPAYRARLKQEMNNFPVWHDDGLDGLSYFYDILADDFWKAKVKAMRPAKENLDPMRNNQHLHIVGSDNQAWMAA